MGQEEEEEEEGGDGAAVRRVLPTPVRRAIDARRRPSHGAAPPKPRSTYGLPESDSELEEGADELEEEEEDDDAEVTVGAGHGGSQAFKPALPSQITRAIQARRFSHAHAALEGDPFGEQRAMDVTPTLPRRRPGPPAQQQQQRAPSRMATFAEGDEGGDDDGADAFGDQRAVAVTPAMPRARAARAASAGRSLHAQARAEAEAGAEAEVEMQVAATPAAPPSRRSSRSASAQVLRAGVTPTTTPGDGARRRLSMAGAVVQAVQEELARLVASGVVVGEQQPEAEEYEAEEEEDAFGAQRAVGVTPAAPRTRRSNAFATQRAMAVTPAAPRTRRTSNAFAEQRMMGVTPAAPRTRAQRAAGRAPEEEQQEEGEDAFVDQRGVAFTPAAPRTRRTSNAFAEQRLMGVTPAAPRTRAQRAAPVAAPEAEGEEAEVVGEDAFMDQRGMEVTPAAPRTRRTSNAFAEQRLMAVTPAAPRGPRPRSEVVVPSPGSTMAGQLARQRQQVVAGGDVVEEWAAARGTPAPRRSVRFSEGLREGEGTATTFTPHPRRGTRASSSAQAAYGAQWEGAEEDAHRPVVITPAGVSRRLSELATPRSEEEEEGAEDAFEAQRALDFTPAPARPARRAVRRGQEGGDAFAEQRGMALTPAAPRARAQRAAAAAQAPTQQQQQQQQQQHDEEEEEEEEEEEGDAFAQQRAMAFTPAAPRKAGEARAAGGKGSQSPPRRRSLLSELGQSDRIEEDLQEQVRVCVGV
jgi:hypothetical protein